MIRLVLDPRFAPGHQKRAQIRPADLEQRPHHVRVVTRQLAAQEIAEEMMVPIPALFLVERHDEQARLLYLGQQRVAARETVGIDNSETMLAKSGEYSAPGLRFALGDISAFADEDAYDLVFSNAALHWLPDHAALLARLESRLAPDGVIAVEMPNKQTGSPMSYQIDGKQYIVLAVSGNDGAELLAYALP